MLSWSSAPNRSWRVAALVVLSLSLAGPPAPVLARTDQPDVTPVPSSARTVDTAGSMTAYGHLPLSFELNQGQADPLIDFVAHGQGYNLALSAGDAELGLDQSSTSPAATAPGSATADQPPTVLGIQLQDAAPHPQVIGEQPLPGTANYLIGNDPSQWHIGIPTYARVRYQNVYPGIDLVYHGSSNGQLEYDFVVAPGTDPSQIRLRLGDTDQVQLGAAGDVVVEASRNQVIQPPPEVYQEQSDVRQSVAASYVVDQTGVLSFALGSYDPGRPLILDPVLVYSTFLGGSGGDVGRGIAVDASGNAYITGSTRSADFPTTPSVLQQTLRGDNNAFVSKLNPAGSALMYSTFVGGSGDDVGLGIAVDAGGSAYITGSTDSADFPTRPGAFQQTLHGGGNAFVSKLNPTGTALVYSTFLGGSGGDVGLAIAVDAVSNAYITGRTSPDFPTTPGAVQRTFGEFTSTDAFVSKLNPAGTALIYSTYLGGYGYTSGNAIAVDVGGNAYVTGSTSSYDFPTTPGAFQRTPGGTFVSKVNPTGTALVYSTFLGGCCNQGNGIAVDAGGNAYIAGSTLSADFPTTPGAFQQTFAGQGNRVSPLGSGDAFVSKLNPTGTALVYSTFLGGSGDEAASGVSVDAAGNAYVTGFTESADFPTTPGAFQPMSGGNAFVSKLNPTGTTLAYSTFLGGCCDQGSAIAVDTSGNAYITGAAISADFRTTPGAFQRTLRGAVNAFVAKIASQLATCTTTLSGSLTTVVVGSGTTCLQNAQVSGAVVVQPGAGLFIEHSTIAGAIIADEPTFFGVCDTTTRSSVSVSGAAGFVLLGDPSDDACGGNHIEGSVRLEDNHHSVEVIASHIGGSLQVEDTSGMGLFPDDSHAEIGGNVIGGALQCTGNVPAPTNDGQPNRVTGARGGQCVGL